MPRPGAHPPSSRRHPLTPLVRRVLYVVTYELCGILLTVLGLVLLGFGGGSSGLVAVAASTVAVTWNFLWTTAFERWERRRDLPERTVRRRIVYTLGFEGGLIVLLLPVMSMILEVSLLHALTLDLGLFAFFLVYTFCFSWLFDVVLPPEGARRRADATAVHGS